MSTASKRAERSRFASTSWARRILAIGLLAGGFALGWQVIRTGLAQAAAASDPALALAWRGNDATALGNLAASRLTIANTSADLGAANHLAELSLRHGPLQPEAAYVLGQIAEKQGQHAQAENLMTLADAISRRDQPTELWLLLAALGTADYRTALVHADALLRTAPSNRAAIIQLLAQVASDPQMSGPLVERLSSQPDWRSDFLKEFGAHTPDPNVPFAVFLRLAAGSAPPTDAELAPYFARLVAQGYYQEAHQRWLQLVSSASAAGSNKVYDGDFSPRPGPPPFSWDITTDASLTAGPESGPGGQDGHALHVEYATTHPVKPARQLLVLAPGEYNLSGKAWFESVPEPRQLGWSIKCANDASTIADVRNGGGGENRWGSFSATFLVPTSKCDAQWLELDGRAGDTAQDLSVWYTSITVDSTAPPPPPVPTQAAGR